MSVQFTDLVFTVPYFQEGMGNVALYHTICTCTLCAFTHICNMEYRTLDPRYTLPYILIRVLYYTKLHTLFTISSHHCHLVCELLTVTNQNYTRYSSYITWSYDPTAAQPHSLR